MEEARVIVYNRYGVHSIEQKVVKAIARTKEMIFQ